MAFVLKLFQDALKLDPRSPFDAKGFGNITFRCQGWMRGDPIKDLGFAGYLCHICDLAWILRHVIGKNRT